MGKYNLIILGPSGSGKTPLGSFVVSNLVIEPHRVREKPRNEGKTGSPDVYYMSHVAYNGLLAVLSECQALSDPEGLPKLQIYQHVLLFSVREAPQVLFLPEELSLAAKRKVEIYGPVLVKLMKHCLPKSLFESHNYVLLLNPWEKPIEEIDKKKIDSDKYDEGKIIAKMLVKRGENQDEITKRLSRLPEELQSWIEIKELANKSPNIDFLDMRNWKHAEHTYLSNAKGRAILAFSAIKKMAKNLPDERREILLNFFPDLR